MARSDKDFVDAGVEIVREHGFPHLTSRTLGEAMGVHSTAIYRHFPQWDLLVMAVTDALLGEAAKAHRGKVMAIDDPRDRLLAIMSLVREETHANPDLAQNLIRLAATPVQVATPEADSLVLIILGALRELGLEDENLVVAYQALENFTVGSNAVDYAGYPDHLEHRLGRRRMVGVPELTSAATSTDDIARINEEAFWFGANALLDACVARASTNGPKPTPARPPSTSRK